MPRQNRVTPFGTLVTTADRGTLMGNRGCLHDAEGRIRRDFVGRRWIACVLSFRDRRRAIMSPGRYTELFFLDEATALAAGHRPCVECQRARYGSFLDHWLAGQPPRARAGRPGVDEVDTVLHRERLAGRQGLAAFLQTPAALPPGAVVADGDQAYLILDGALWPWSTAGYGAPRPLPAGAMRVLTPLSVVRAITNGYAVAIHPTAGGGQATPARPLT